MESVIVEIKKEMLYAYQRNQEKHNCKVEFYSPGREQDTCRVKILFPYQQPAFLVYLSIAATADHVSFYSSPPKTQKV